MTDKIKKRLKIKVRIRGKISGTATTPRMSVFRSNKQIYVQLIDDSTGKTLTSASSLEFKDTSKNEKSIKTGEKIAQKALDMGIKTVVFDRNGYLYHGRIKELAEAARKGGLKF